MMGPRKGAPLQGKLRTPIDLGAPSKFKEWRENQLDAVLDAATSDRRFVEVNAPTGFGKSLFYMMLAKLLGGRVCILTSTKGLMDQLKDDFWSMLLADIRGKANYRCVLEEDKRVSCADGVCHMGTPCPYFDGGCLYFDAYRKAKTSAIVSTNYPYWLYNNAYGEGLGQFDILILDEAHAAYSELADFLSVQIKASVLRRLGVALPDDDWKPWAQYTKPLMKFVIQELKEAYRDGDTTVVRNIREAKKLERDLERLEHAAVSQWVYHKEGSTYCWDPIHVHNYAEVYLFRGVKKVVLVSAVLTEEMAAQVGAHGDFLEYPSTFPVERRPFIWIPTVRVDWGMDDTHMRSLIAKADNIIRQRQDRKVMIHTTSYARRDYFMAHTDFRGKAITHDTATARARVEEFKKAPPGAVLVSPSMTTGWNFPYAECECQILLKVPFPSSKDPVYKARKEHDKEFGNKHAATTLVQTYGRIDRAEDDQGETFILDDHIEWFYYHKLLKQKLAPSWFLEAYRVSERIPKPPPRLQ